MGMAASQARYLALVARKSNCEYEGQQINQARTVLSNQSANLFNQLLGLSVPVPPSTSDFTKQQYSYSDGATNYTITNWEQLANPEEDYNYVVTRTKEANVYTGSQKKLSDPQVQFQSGIDASVDQIEKALKLVTSTKKDYEAAQAETKKAQEAVATLSNYADNNSFKNISKCTYVSDNGKDQYEVTQNNYYTKDNISYPQYNYEGSTDKYYLKDGKYYKVGDDTEAGEGFDNTKLSADTTSTTFTAYNTLKNTDLQAKVKATIDKLEEAGAISKDDYKDYAGVYVDEKGNIAFKSDLRNLYGGESGGSSSILSVYPVDATNTKIDELNAEVQKQKSIEQLAFQTYENAESAYNSLKRPTYIGNCSLTLLTDLTEDQKAELSQVLKDMKAQEIDTSIANCFNEYGEYTGGIYTFTMNGKNYYTTYADLDKSYASGDGINNIDDQVQLSYYNASYIKQTQSETVKALLETDGNGRFTTVRFDDDSVKYALNSETITDDLAYKDAMNQYNYENAQYDKMVQDINAKTSLIQQEDQQLELRLKQLDTEQNALSTEIDAVSKVVKDNVEKSFKTFGG